MIFLFMQCYGPEWAYLTRIPNTPSFCTWLPMNPGKARTKLWSSLQTPDTKRGSQQHIKLWTNSETRSRFSATWLDEFLRLASPFKKLQEDGDLTMPNGWESLFPTEQPFFLCGSEGLSFSSVCMCSCSTWSVCVRRGLWPRLGRSFRVCSEEVISLRNWGKQSDWTIEWRAEKSLWVWMSWSSAFSPYTESCKIDTKGKYSLQSFSKWGSLYQLQKFNWCSNVRD